MAHLSLLRYSIFGMIVACLLIQAEGQFFTKGAKSIPRMGRRSVSERPQQRLNALRRQLIGRLLDEYGPDVAMNMKEVSIVIVVALIRMVSGLHKLNEPKPIDRLKVDDFHELQYDHNEHHF